MIEIKDLKFNYKGNDLIFDNFNIVIQDGQSLGIVGDNGAGKSTLIKLILSIIQPKDGGIYFEGKNIRKYRKQIMKQVGVVWGQRSSLWWDLSIKDSMIQLCKIYDIDTKQMNRNIEYYLKKTTLQEYWNQLLRKVSTGQRVLADIIAVLIREPKYIILDEAFIGLDYQTKKTIIELLNQYKKEHINTAFVITSHDFSDITSLCDSILILQKNMNNFEMAVDELLIYKNTELNIEFNKEIQLQNNDAENIHVMKINKYKYNISVNGELNNFLRMLDWNSIESIDMKDKTMDMIIEKLKEEGKRSDE